MDKLDNIIEFFKEKEGWDFNQLISDVVSETKLIDMTPDEIWVDGRFDGEEYGCDDMIAFGGSMENAILHSRLAELQRTGAAFPKLAETILVFPDQT